MKKYMFITILLTCFGMVNVSYAGKKNPASLVIASPTQFQGSLGSIRNSANNIEYLWIFDYSGSGALIMAKDSAGTAASCFTNDPNHMALIEGLVDSSFLSVHHESGTCTYITNINASVFEPKQ